MTYYKEAELSNGKNCILRNPCKEDAEKILEHIKITSGETNHMMRYPDEVKMTVAQEEEFLIKLNNNPTSCMICAEVDGIIAANGGMNVSEPVERCSHRASFGISVKKEFWGLGLGTMILNGIIEKAREAGYEFLELEVVTHNERGRRLYEKMGFKEYGLRKKAFKYRDNSYADIILMTYEL